MTLEELAQRSTTKTLYAVVPFTVMTVECQDGTWETLALDVPATGGIGTDPDYSEMAACQAVRITCEHLFAAILQGGIQVVGESQNE